MRITNAHHLRVVAAYKGQLTRVKAALARALAKPAPKKKRKRTPPKAITVTVPPPKAITVTVPELVLYESDADSAVPAFVEWDEWGLRATMWVVNVVLLIEGAQVANDTLRIAVDWTTEPASKTVRRELRVWYDGQIAAHPRWAQSPQAAVYRLSLAQDG